ncbi:MAG: Veg family protein [Eubacterium sp.]|nr:Veg family protein [Eubacterium sp.]
MSNSDFCRVRESVRSQLGSKVMIKQDRGRNRIEIQEGVLQNAYPSVFTILIENRRNANPPQLLSFSYTDIITKEIRMKLC